MMRDEPPLHDLPPTAPEPLPWERQASEPEDAFRAFKTYRDMRPPRRTRSVVGISINVVLEWYKTYRWPERIDAYDRHMDRLALLEREAQLKQNSKEVSAEHMAMLQTARQLAQRELDKLFAISGDANNDAPLLRPVEVIRLSEMVIKLDRLVRGESTDAPEIKTDLSKLSLEQLRQLHEIKKKMGQE